MFPAWQSCPVADYVGLIIALGTGVPLLVLAVWLDARRRRQLEGDAGAPPERGDETVDSHVPTYLTQSQVDALPLPGRGTTAPREHPGTRLGFGHAGAEFATHQDTAVRRGVRILMVDGEITSWRELLAVMPLATADSALVVAATAIADEVLATLRANRRVLDLPIVAATPSAKDLYELLGQVGGEVLGVEDLKAGYVPESALGRADTWTSNAVATWVDTANPQPEA